MQLRRAIAGALLILAFLYVPLLAQERSANPRAEIRMLRMPRTSSLLRRMNELGDTGFRLRAYFPDRHEVVAERKRLSPYTGGVAILEKVPNATGRYRYLEFASSGRDRLEAFLNHVGAEGFTLVPRGVTPSWYLQAGAIVVWLEKPPGTKTRYAYRVIDWGTQRLLKATFNPKFWFTVNPLEYIGSELRRASDQGYHLVRALPFGVVILQKAEISPAGDTSPPTSEVANAASQYYSLGQHSARDLQRELNNLAASGYHIADLVPDSHVLWPVILLERDNASPIAPSDRFEYHVLQGSNLETLTSGIKESAAAGFRLLPESLCRFNPLPLEEKKEYRAVLEKRPGAGGSYEYRFVGGTDVFALREAITRAAAERFSVIGVIDSLSVIMERSAPPAAGARQ